MESIGTGQMLATAVLTIVEARRREGVGAIVTVLTMEIVVRIIGARANFTVTNDTVTPPGSG